MGRIVDIAQGLLLLMDAARDRDEVARLVVLKWFTEKQRLNQLQSQGDWQAQVPADMKIVFGMQGPSVNKARL